MRDGSNTGPALNLPPAGLIEPSPEGSGLGFASGAGPPETDVDGHLSGLFGRDAIYLLLWALQIGLAAVVTPIATRLLGTESFGAVVSANAVMQVLFVFVCLGLSTGVERRYFEPGGPAAVRRLLTLSIIFSVVITGAVALTGQWWCRSLGFSGYTSALKYAVLWAGVSGVTAVCLSILRVQDRLLPFSVVSLVQSVIAEVTSLALLEWWAPTAGHFVLGQLAAQVAAIAFGVVWIRPALFRRADFDATRRTLAYTIPLVPAALSGIAMTAANRLILQKQLGETQVARYQIAYNIGSIPILLLGLINGAWMPRFFSLRSSDDRGKLIAASRDMLSRMLVPMMIGLSFGAPLVLRVWAPSSYRPDRLLIVLFLIVASAVPFSAGLSATRALLMTGHTSTIALASFVGAAVNIGLNIVMINAYGLAGAAAATLVSIAVVYLVLELKARVVLPTPRASRITSVTLVVAAGASWGLALLSESPLFLVLRGIGATLCVAWFVAINVMLRRREKTRSDDQVAVSA